MARVNWEKIVDRSTEVDVRECSIMVKMPRFHKMLLHYGNKNTCKHSIGSEVQYGSRMSEPGT